MDVKGVDFLNKTSFFFALIDPNKNKDLSEQLKEMDEINPTLGQVDVVIVIGANDVVNPVARTDPNSPIAGMPIIDVDKARTVIIIKRSLSPGFAGIPNPLFAADNTLMLFGDGQKAVLEILNAMKDL